MITAIVMIDAATDSIPEVAAALADLDGVSEVYSTAGEVDLIAIVRVREFDQVAEVIAGRINKVPGVLACPAPGTGAFTGFLARVETGRTDRDPFADGRSLGTRARPDRVTAGAGARSRPRLGLPA